MQFGFILSLIFAIIIAVFALLNDDKVTVDFVFAEIEVSQAIVIFVSAALGAIIVTILGLIRQVKLGFKIKEQSKRISILENEKQVIENELNEMLSKSNLDSDKSKEVILRSTINSDKDIDNVLKSEINDKEKIEGTYESEEKNNIK